MSPSPSERSNDVLQGTLDMLILKAVSLGALHGYGVLLRIEQVGILSGDFFLRTITGRIADEMAVQALGLESTPDSRLLSLLAPSPPSPPGARRPPSRPPIRASRSAAAACPASTEFGRILP